MRTCTSPYSLTVNPSAWTCPSYLGTIPGNIPSVVCAGDTGEAVSPRRYFLSLFGGSTIRDEDDNSVLSTPTVWSYNGGIYVPATKEFWLTKIFSLEVYYDAISAVSPFSTTLSTNTGAKGTSTNFCYNEDSDYVFTGILRTDNVWSLVGWNATDKTAWFPEIVTSHVHNDANIFSVQYWQGNGLYYLFINGNSGAFIEIRDSLLSVVSSTSVGSTTGVGALLVDAQEKFYVFGHSSVDVYRLSDLTLLASLEPFGPYAGPPDLRFITGFDINKSKTHIVVVGQINSSNAVASFIDVATDSIVCSFPLPNPAIDPVTYAAYGAKRVFMRFPSTPRLDYYE